MMMALTTTWAAGLVTAESLSAARTLLDGAYSATYGERLTIGRKAQLGDDLIYRPGDLGCTIDSSLTYGEYNLDFFAECMECALEGLQNPARQLSFVDVGSGVGRLVLASSLLWPERFACCAGVEKVSELHELACDAEARMHVSMPHGAPPRKFICGDAADVLTEDGPLADADLLFAYSSTWPSEGDELSDFSVVCGTHLREGTRVITTDRRLCTVEGLWRFDVLATLEGPNRETGGTSIGYVQEVRQSRRGRGT